jgi:hypothetical protein
MRTTTVARLLLRGASMTKEEEEWARAAKAGRRRKLPFVFGALAGTIVIVATLVTQAMIAQHRQDRANAGETVYEYEGTRTNIEVFFAPVLLGALAFTIAFKVAGGKIPIEYIRGLRG